MNENTLYYDLIDNGNVVLAGKSFFQYEDFLENFRKEFSNAKYVNSHFHPNITLGDCVLSGFFEFIFTNSKMNGKMESVLVIEVFL